MGHCHSNWLSLCLIRRKHPYNTDCFVYGRVVGMQRTAPANGATNICKVHFTLKTSVTEAILWINKQSNYFSLWDHWNIRHFPLYSLVFCWFVSPSLKLSWNFLAQAILCDVIVTLTFSIGTCKFVFKGRATRQNLFISNWIMFLHYFHMKFRYFIQK